MKQSTSKKSQVKIVPDEKDSLNFFIEGKNEERDSAVIQASEEGQLAVDVFQTADEIIVVAPIAGVSIDDIVINITDDVLVIKGSRDFKFTVEDSDYFTKECFWGGFSRSVILPEAVDSSRVTASFKNGILTVRIPKVEKIRTRMIKIKEE